ncbi:hypothetical protein N5K37_32285, partial [Delftia tsuruhatensis]|uniref:hypothetical protein n=1 Tax=Delftia tsuruhatensis TaxID=180282 RepID=UPI00244869A5
IGSESFHSIGQSLLLPNQLASAGAAAQTAIESESFQNFRILQSIFFFGYRAFSSTPKYLNILDAFSILYSEKSRRISARKHP